MNSRNDEKVSIIIPVYNNEKYIEKCIRSVLKQNYKNLEVIVINDGSVDQSGAIIEKIAKEDNRIKYVFQKNAGVSNARNKGIRMATGKYLTFVDGDDYIGDNYILDLIQCSKKTEADMVVCGLTMVDTNDNVMEEIIPGDYVRFEKEEWTFRISAVAAHFYKKELWDKYEIFFYEGERGEDIPIALFFSGVCDSITTLKKADYFYVQHNASASHNFQGLKSFSLPYQAVKKMIIKMNEVGIKNSREFHELFVLRILATFIQLAKGADKKEIQKLYEYMIDILDNYYPDYYKNKKTKIFNKIEIPLVQKIAVLILIYSKRFGMLYWMLRIACK